MRRVHYGDHPADCSSHGERIFKLVLDEDTASNVS